MASLRKALILGLAVISPGCLVRREPDGAQTTVGEPCAVTTAGGIDMVRLPGGWFEMGNDDAADADSDEPRHRVFISPLAIDTHEVTQAEYERLMGGNPSRWKGAENPVEQIRWTEAAAYCNARSREEGLQPAYDPKTWECDFAANGYRLPTEAEWEYAARAGSQTAYSFGDRPAALEAYAWFKGNATRGAHTAAQKKPNAWGLYDTCGNVWEWCNDFYQDDYYRASPDRDPRGPDKGNKRVVRGGCWNSRPDECCSSYRNYEFPQFTDVCFGRDVHGQVGFRCVRGE